MARMARYRKPPATTAAELHRAWLDLVDCEGPFLAIPPLKRVWPNGIPDFRTTHSERFDVLIDARKDFESAWEALDRNPANDTTLQAYRVARDLWAKTVLGDVAGWAESMSWGEVPGVQAQSPDRTVTITAQAALQSAEGIGALVHVVDPVDSLRQTPSDLWAATAIDRLEALLRENKVEIGIVTDGRWWGLVCAREGSMVASGIVDALTWVEEPRTRDAFLTLIGRQHIIGGDPVERLPALFVESVAAAEEITEALGAQVRRAVELLIQSFSESAATAHQRGHSDPLPTRTHDTYEAAVTVMMRVVFLLFAEERSLLPTGQLFEQGYGISRELTRLVARESEESEEALDATSLTWHRLLATSQALYSGASFEGLRMPAYGGSLFDPTRFPFLTVCNEHGTLAVTVSDRVMLHVLRSVQLVILRSGEARQISFRDIDVEQIGYIYEGLLGYTCVTVDETYLGLLGKPGEETEIPLSTLENFATAAPDPKELAGTIRAWVAEDQPSAKPPSLAGLVKALNAKVDPSAVSALTQAVGDNYELRDRVRPWLGVIRQDLRTHPFVVLSGGLLVKETPSRKNAGAHYTPKSLAEELVLHALQPLCYSPGPHQAADESTWKLKSSDELLALKVADIACGSGAFLVAAANYIADRVVEAWVREDPANEHRKDLRRRATRQVVANCLYGADINDMAVEMCKLSLWLVSLDRDLPFSFVDDKVFLGNSLLGLTNLDQLRKLHIDPARVSEQQVFDIFDADIGGIIRKAVDLRQRLATEIDEGDPARNSAAKRRQLRQLHQITSELRKVADGVIAAGLRLGGKPGTALDESYENLRLAVRSAFLGDSADSSTLDALIEAGLTPTVETDYDRWRPLHWVLEAPDVLVERGGFDSIVGNPPFLGSTKLAAAIGNVHDWIAATLSGGRKGKADLVGFFFLKAAELLTQQGTLGLIATNSIGQGDTREVALDRLSARGLEFVRCVQSAPWPTKAAKIEYAAVWAAWQIDESCPRFAEGVQVAHISSLLEATGRDEGLPVELTENSDIAFEGIKTGSTHFVVELPIASGWIDVDPTTKDVVRPYLGGKDVTNRFDSSPSRYVIDFNAMPEHAAEAFSVPWNYLRERIWTPQLEDTSWWLHARSRPALRSAIADLREMIVITRVSDVLLPMRVPTVSVPSDRLTVFASDSFALFGALSSSPHTIWAIKYGTTHETRLTYNPSAVFETFPLPAPSQELEDSAQSLDALRRAIMTRRGLGLTKLYSLVHDPEVADNADPDIGRMRSLHVDLDEAVIGAYGWADLTLGHGFHSYRQWRRWTVSPAARVKLFDRLLKENHRRAAAEKTSGVEEPKRRRTPGLSRAQETLFQ